MIKNHGGTVLSFAGFVSAPWGPIFYALSILMSFLPDSTLEKLADEILIAKPPVKIVILDNLEELDNYENRLSVESYKFKINENQTDVGKDGQLATGDKYSKGTLIMLPGYTSDNASQVADLFQMYLNIVAEKLKPEVKHE